METFKKRLKALDAKVAQEALILTEEQLRALEKARKEKQAHGEIETEHPSYLLAQDAFYICTINGVGRIYQQTVKHVHPYDTRPALRLQERSGHRPAHV